MPGKGEGIYGFSSNCDGSRTDVDYSRSRPGSQLRSAIAVAETRRVPLPASYSRRLNVAAFLERSRSGNGGHVWLFFEEAVPAALARRLGAYILTETMEFRPDIGLDSTGASGGSRISTHRSRIRPRTGQPGRI